MPELAELKGINGGVVVHDDRVEISRDSVAGFTSQGGASGRRSFFYGDISMVEFMAPSRWKHGYIRILVPGSSEVKARVGLTGPSMSSFKDPNTVVIRAGKIEKTKEAEEAYNLLIQKLAESKKVPQNVD